ncbi:MAG TPA: sulfite exporter TauE/SafE family protein [Ilumatobacteraceae bacterium]|nr:sulfite exporter TauE/SafE family protein [Ilumatobacteraceae bacterium]
MSTEQIIAVVVIIAVAAVTSAVAGFAFGLMSVPALAMVVPTHQAVVVSSVIGIAVSAIQTVQWNRDAVRPLVWRMFWPAVIAMPLGYWIFLTIDERWLKLSLGIAVLIAVVLLIRHIDLRHAGRRLDYTAGFLSGVLNTSLSTNGPPLVFALQARRLEPDQFRGTLVTIFALSNLVSVPLFIASGKATGDNLLAALFAVPGLLGGLWVGGRIRPRVNAVQFRWVVIVLLIAAGISSVATALA